MLGICRYSTNLFLLPSTILSLLLAFMLARSFAFIPAREVSRLVRTSSSPLLGSLAGRLFAPNHKSARYIGSHSANNALAYEDLALDLQGEIGTKSHRVYLTRKGQKISFWHDVPLKNGLFHNFICEIPKFSKAKMEVCKEEAFNPIAQDLKKGELRFYDGPIYWNYGCMPQTWEDPEAHNEIPAKGDNDPLDVVEIGSKSIATGSIVPVKVLGVLAMIDDGELDWKVIAINADDPMASRWNDVEDIDNHVVSGIREWFRWYKVPSGKPLNKFEFNEMCLPAAVAHDVVKETHEHWRRLVRGEANRDNSMWTTTSEQLK